jgi:hypothetical protein
MRWTMIREWLGIGAVILVVLCVSYESTLLAIAVAGAEAVMYCLGFWHGTHVVQQLTAYDVDES